MIPLRIAALALVALLFGACGPLVEGGGSDLVAAHVVDVIETGEHQTSASASQPFERVHVQLDESLYRGDVIELEWNGKRGLDENGFLHPGDRVLLSVTRNGNDRAYAIQEVVRLPSLAPIAVLLVLLLFVIARLRGLVVVAGLVLGVAVLLLALVPALRAGGDPLVPALLGSLAAIVIVVLSFSGIERRSLVAMGGAIAGIGIVTGVGALAIAMARLTGLTGDAQTLLASSGHATDMPRLVLAGVVIGALGVLVDLAIAQTSTVVSLASRDEALRGRRLFGSALHAGRAHAAALLSALAFAYLGAALPIVLVVFVGSDPLALAANSEAVATWAAGILAGGVGIALAVPITTLVAVLFAGPAEPLSIEY